MGSRLNAAFDWLLRVAGDHDAAALQETAFGEVEIDEGDAVADERLHFLDTRGEQVATGLGYLQGGAGSYFEPFVFAGDDFL